MGDERLGPGKNISFGGFSFKRATNSSNTQKTYSMNAVRDIIDFISWSLNKSHTFLSGSTSIIFDGFSIESAS